MPVDKFGKRIYEGNRLALEIGGKMLCGVVAKIDEGGSPLVAKNGNPMHGRPGALLILVEVQYMFDPRGDGRCNDLILTMDQPNIGKLAFEIPPGTGKEEMPS